MAKEISGWLVTIGYHQRFLQNNVELQIDRILNFERFFNRSAVGISERLDKFGLKSGTLLLDVEENPN